MEGQELITQQRRLLFLFLHILLMASWYKDLMVVALQAQGQWMAAVMANITVAHTIIDINVVLTRRGTSTHNTYAVSLLRLRTAQLVSGCNYIISQASCPSSELCMTANTIHVSLKHGFIILQHGLNKSNRPPQPSHFPRARRDPHIPVWWTLSWWQARRSMSTSHHHDPRSGWWNPTKSTSPITNVQRR